MCVCVCVCVARPFVKRLRCHGYCMLFGDHSTSVYYSTYLVMICNNTVLFNVIKVCRIYSTG